MVTEDKVEGMEGEGAMKRKTFEGEDKSSRLLGREA